MENLLKYTKAWFPYSQFRPQQWPILSQNKAISGKDDCSILEFAVNRNRAANFSFVYDPLRMKIPMILANLSVYIVFSSIWRTQSGNSIETLPL